MTSFYDFNGFGHDAPVINQVKYAPPQHSNYHQTPLRTPAYLQPPSLAPIFPMNFNRKPFPPNLAPKRNHIYHEMIGKKLNAVIDPVHSFKYDEKLSLREKSLDASGNIKG